MKKVLLVEDNADDRMHIAEMIRNCGVTIDVHAVGTGEEAMDYFKNSKPHCSIVDYRLEAEDGLTILAEMTHLSPYHPVIMMTGQGNEELAATSMKEGAADYLVKQSLTGPFLKKVIDNAISRSDLEEKVAEQEDARRRFLGILVHDLRAPLSRIQQLGDIAIKEISSGDMSEMTYLLETQSTIAKRATNLINTLESYALLDAEVSFSSVPLKKVAEEAKENVGLLISEQQATVVISQLPTVNGHHAQLTQLFQNLIQNALKYNENTQPAVTIEQEDSVTVVVSDNGIGIPEEHWHTIFEPLKRLWGSGKYEGTGIGLATCKKIVQRHQGEIWCTSCEGEGSKFYVRLQAAQ